MTATGWVFVVVGVVPFAVYLAVRLGAAAWFKSKQQYETERRKHNGTQQKP